MAQFGKPEYWEDKYQRDTEPFDWYQRWEGVRDIVTQYLQKDYKILNIGCGNSRMSEEMYEEGYETITNMDISFSVVKSMEEEYKEKCPNMNFKVLDVRSMPEVESDSYDWVIDKGTLDTVLCGFASGVNSKETLAEINRVLVNGGVYICISYGTEEERRPYFEKSDFKLQNVHSIAKQTISTSSIVDNADKDPKNFHYIYVMRKKVGPAPQE